MDGKVKWFSRKRGYGFIEHDGGDDVFVHISGMNNLRRHGKIADQPVTFDMGEHDGKPIAVNVTLQTASAAAG